MGVGHHVLLFGYDLELLKKREAGLRDAGFEVDSASSLERALALAQRRRYQLAIVGHFVGEQERNRLAVALKSASHRVPVIFLYCDSIHNAGLADAVLNVSAGQEDLVAAAHDLIGGPCRADCGA